MLTASATRTESKDWILALMTTCPCRSTSPNWWPASAPYPPVPAGVPPVLACGALRLDPARQEATRGGRHVELTPKEFAVLQVRLEAEGRVVPAEELLERAWDEMADPFSQRCPQR
jgi:DNA-binding response OmpR family regulator